MRPVKEVEIHFAKIGFVVVDYIWSYLNAPRSYTLALIHFGDPLWRDLSPACWKMECCMWPVREVEIHFAKIGFVDCK